MSLDHDIPINVIVLEDTIEHSREELVDCYMDILKSCRKADEFKSLIQMIISEVRELTLREIIVRNIQHQAKILEETKLNKY